MLFVQHACQALEALHRALMAAFNVHTMRRPDNASMGVSPYPVAGCVGIFYISETLRCSVVV